MTTHIICDPVHGIMEFEKDIYNTIKCIIDTKHFQRLRHIKQLSFVEFAYPGAVHTRFNHCIGAAYLATRLIKIIGIKGQYKKELIVAALLHDIGHGPFSHAFEHIYGEHFSISHEKWGEEFLKELKKEIRDSKIKKLISSAKEILKGESKDNERKFLHKCISSQLDVDRIDYLLRDSHFCGVAYGHFDVDWLMSCMERNDGEIVIIRKGEGSAEQYIMARRLMTHYVYSHKKNYGAIYLFKILIEKIIEKKYHHIKNKGPLWDFIKIVNKNISKIKSGKSEVKENMVKKHKIINAILKDGFKYYSKLTDHDFWLMIRGFSFQSKDQILNEVANRFIERKLPHVYYVNEGYISYIIKEIEQLKNGLGDDEWRLRFESKSILSYVTKDKNDSDEEIDVADNLKKNSMKLNPYHSIQNDSYFLRAISDKREKIGYIYYCESSNSKTNKLIIDTLKKLKVKQYIY